jgi:quinoprotein glucose dehydrogenase
MVAVLVLVLLAGGEDSAAPPSSPRIAGASDEGLLAIRRMRVAPGFQIGLFAAEPLLANPVAFCLDEKGSIFVAETFRIHAGVDDTRDHMEWLDDDLAARTVEDRVAMYRKFLGSKVDTYALASERVRLLQDLDGDGTADRSLVYAEGFNGIPDGIAAGVLARRGQVWFSCIPHLWLLEGSGGGGKAQSLKSHSRKSLHRGYGVHVGYYGHDLHGLRFGPDGRIYFSIGDRGLHVETEGRVLDEPDSGSVLRSNPDGSALEIFARGLRNPQELAFNEYGDLFTGDNNSDGGDQARWVHVVEGGDSGWRIGYQFLETRGPWNEEKLWHPRWDGQAAYLVPPVANLADGPSGLAYHPGTGFPDRYAGRFFLCDFRGSSALSGIRSFALRPRGASYELVDPDQFIWSVLATDVDFGPDGALYLSDWVEGWDQPGKGRIYRVFDPESARDPRTVETRKLLSEGMSGRPPEELARLLAHADQRVRQEAQFALAEMGRAAAPILASVAERGSGRLPRIHALWALGQIARKEGRAAWSNACDPLLSLLEAPDDEVRAQAAKVLGECAHAPSRDRLIAALRDPSPRVRYFAALGAGKLGFPEAVRPLLDLLRDEGDRDPVLRHAAAYALASVGEVPRLLEAAATDSTAARRGVLLALRRLSSPEAARFLDDPDPDLVLEAARAIHDLPIERALPRLAALSERSGLSPPLARRAINARFRLGRPEDATALARLAARADLAEEMRLEALSALEEFSKPPGRDRVVGLWRPLPPRPAGLAADALRSALAEILAGGTDRLCAEASRLAGAWGIMEAGPALRAVLTGGKKGGEARAAALRALAALGGTGLEEPVRLALEDREAAVRIEGRRLLAKLDPAQAIPALEASLKGGSTSERQGAFETLGAMEASGAGEVLLSWLDRLRENGVDPAVELDCLEAARRWSAPRPGAGEEARARLREGLARREAALAGKDPAAGRPECLEGGDASRGRKIFHQKTEVNCLRCHKAEGKGGEVGPDLAGIGGRQKRDYLLESMLAPDRQIAKGFETVVLLLKDGRVETGVLKEEDSRELRIALAEGKVLAVPVSTIRSRERGPSAMPADVIRFLTDRDLRDLVEYLASLK